MATLMSEPINHESILQFNRGVCLKSLFNFSMEVDGGEYWDWLQRRDGRSRNNVTSGLQKRSKGLWTSSGEGPTRIKLIKTEPKQENSKKGSSTVHSWGSLETEESEEPSAAAILGVKGSSSWTMRQWAAHWSADNRSCVRPSTHLFTCTDRETQKEHTLPPHMHTRTVVTDVSDHIE